MPLLLQTLVTCRTAVEVVELYKTSNPTARRIIREFHPRLKMEFDAIDQTEDQQRRLAALVTVGESGRA